MHSTIFLHESIQVRLFQAFRDTYRNAGCGLLRHIHRTLVNYSPPFSYIVTEYTWQPSVPLSPFLKNTDSPFDIYRVCVAYHMSGRRNA